MMRFITLILLLLAIGISYRNARQNRSYAFVKERKTIETLQAKKGVIRNIGSNEDPVYIITFQEQSINLFPCNLSEEFMHNNKPVQFSGNMKYMYPLEDEYGQYFEVKEMREE